MTDRRVIRPTGIVNSPGYSHAIVKAGMPVFISGQVAQDGKGNVVGRGDAEAQARQVFQNLRTVVTAAGGSMADIVKITVFATDIAFRAAVVKARTEAFQAGFMPASTFVVVAGLADPAYLVEVEAVAMIDA
jgi:enamine deaminase RidA (YjgF/YER057c/UK114 family)